MTWTLFTDGGSRGNPGPAGAGIVLEDPSGRTVYAVGLYLGSMTNNAAEYRALLAGLEEAVRREVRGLRVVSDSELIVRQINGQYRVKSADLLPLYEQVKALLRRIPAATVVHVRREENQRADALVNRALDAKRDVAQRPGGEAPPPAATWPPDRFRAVCSTAPNEPCPNGLVAGKSWTFYGVTPAGLCVHAATGILGAVAASQAGSESVTAPCARVGCGALFTVHFR